MRPNFVTNIFTVLVMLGVTVWSCVDGGQSFAMIVTATAGVLAFVMILSHVAASVPQTRFWVGLLSGTWVAVLMPVWDWLAGQFTYPLSVWSALGFGVGFGIFRFAITPGGPARPPS